MRTFNFIVRLFAAFIISASTLAQTHKEVELYRWVDFPFEAPGAAAGVARWDIAGTCTWTHTTQNGTTERTSLLWYSGEADTYIFRFGASLRDDGPAKQNRPSRSSTATISASFCPPPTQTAPAGAARFKVNRLPGRIKKVSKATSQKGLRSSS